MFRCHCGRTWSREEDALRCCRPHWMRVFAFETRDCDDLVDGHYIGLIGGMPAYVGWILLCPKCRGDQIDYTNHVAVCRCGWNWVDEEMHLPERVA